MLIKLIEYLKRETLLLYPHAGTVISNADPDKLGRIRCSVETLWGGSEPDALPWVYPKQAAFLGGSALASSFAAPEIGTEVLIEFPYNDLYMPVYTGYWHAKTMHPALFDENYPNSWGFLDSKNNFFRVNKDAGTIEIQHSSGTVIRYDPDNIEIQHVSGSFLRYTPDEIQVTHTNGSFVKVTASEVEVGHSGGSTLKMTPEDVTLAHAVGSGIQFGQSGGVAIESLSGTSINAEGAGALSPMVIGIVLVEILAAVLIHEHPVAGQVAGPSSTLGTALAAQMLRLLSPVNKNN